MGQQQVPCLFFFGDSLVDNGNNNVLKTILKANYRPNGIDYPGGVPTGRFSNGRNLADFLAQLLGFSTPIPPFATANGSDVLRGVNYASGGGGILDGTGIQLGKVLSFNEQLQNHRTTIKHISSLLGNQTATESHLNECFLGSRKIVVYGLTTLGCIPEELIRYPTHGSAYVDSINNGAACVDSINNGVDLYNKKLFSLLNDLNDNLAGARFVFVNLTDLSSANPSATGTFFFFSLKFI
ncbi:hypothetical protein ACS0TY_031531 [Phlomoides rotata]